MVALEKLAAVGYKEDQAPPGEEAPAAPLVETFKMIKEAKKVTITSLARFISQIGKLLSLPEAMVAMSVNKRVLARGTEGEFKPLPEPVRVNRRPPGRDGQGGFQKDNRGRGRRDGHMNEERRYGNKR